MREERRRIGAGRVLIACYAVFVVAAGSRGTVQLATHADRAPLAYGLSLLAALVYLFGLLLLVRAERGGSPRAAALCCGVELAGVLSVGIASIIRPSAFPDATVWSHFGSGYGPFPLVLPVLALCWLRSRAGASGIDSTPEVCATNAPASTTTPPAS
jgi:hypothetical protein